MLKKYLICVLLISPALAAKRLIKRVTVDANRVDIAINTTFKNRYLKDDFFVEYARDINLEQFDYSIVTLPFIMNVASLVWISQEEWEIEEMDADIYESLQRIKKVFSLMHPKTLWTGKFAPKKLVKHSFETLENPQTQIALLFSGGIDSTASSFYHRDTPQLLITAWGQSCLPLDHPNLWHQIKGHIDTFAHQYGHQTTFLKSNYYYMLNFAKLKTLSPEIVTWRIDTIEDIGWAGLIAPILISRGINTLRIASSDNWNLPYGSAANPYIDSNISFCGIKLYHDLFSMSRLDKIAYMTNLCNRNLIEKPQFIVCQQPGNIINCAVCEKCCLTLAHMLSVGSKPKDYGYNSLSSLQAAKNIKKHLETEKELSISTIWEYQELQKKLKTTPCRLLRFLEKIDFAKIPAYDLKDSEELDWKALDRLFPHVKKETT